MGAVLYEQSLEVPPEEAPKKFMVQPVTLQMLKGGTFGPCGRVLVWRCTIRILETPTFCQPSALNFNCRMAPKGTSINIPCSQKSSVHSSNTRLWRVHLYQRVQSNQVPVGEESFRHRNYLLEGGSRIWLWHLKGTQADTAKIYFYRLPTWYWAKGECTEMEQDHTLFCLALLPSHKEGSDTFSYFVSLHKENQSSKGSWKHTAVLPQPQLTHSCCT